MKKTTIQHTLGIDLGDRKHTICIIDQAGEVIQESRISNTRENLARPRSIISLTHFYII